MHHMDFIYVIKGVIYTGGEISIILKLQHSKFDRFFVWVICFKHDKTAGIASILMKYLNTSSIDID